MNILDILFLFLSLLLSSPSLSSAKAYPYSIQKHFTLSSPHKQLIANLLTNGQRSRCLFITLSNPNLRLLRPSVWRDPWTGPAWRAFLRHLFLPLPFLLPSLGTPYSLRICPPASQQAAWLHLLGRLPLPLFYSKPHIGRPCPPSCPSETVYAVDQLPSDSFSGGFSAAVPDGFAVAFPSTEWQPLDESQILSTAKIEALCRSIGLSNPNFSAMEPPIPDPLEPVPMAYTAPSPPPFAEPVPAALNRRRKAQRQLDAVLKGSEVPQENKRGRKPLALGAPKAKYMKKVPGAPKESAKPKRAYNRRTRGSADLTSVQRSR